MTNLTAKFLTVSVASNGLKFNLGNGKSLSFDITKVSKAVQEQAMMHGFNQKIRDAAAGFSKNGDYTGAFDAMNAVIEALNNGSWNRTGGGESTGGILAEAIARIKNVGLEKAQGAVGKATEEQKKLWMQSAAVKAMIATIRAERAKAAAGSKDDDLDIDLG